MVPRGIIAREVALDISDNVYSPDMAKHIPGVANVAADALSRLNQPGKSKDIPEYLRSVTRTVIAPRTQQWWRALPASPIG